MATLNYNRIVKEDTFIGQYMKYMSAIETSSSYDFWCAIWLIGAFCGRTVLVDRPRAPVYLNWYLILAAESGITRKSTAIRETGRVLNSADRVDGYNSPLVISGRLSPEQLEGTLGELSRNGGEANAALIFSELVTVLGKEGYLQGMPGLLTDLYDGDTHFGRRGRSDIIHPYISFLSASTPAWLVSAVNAQVVEGGFASRVIFICDEKRKRSIAWPHDTEEAIRDRARRILEDDTRSAREIGRIQINPTGLAKFTRWYNTRSPNTDSFRASFEAREDDHVLRLAACLAVNDRTFEIQKPHINLAIRIIADVKDRAFELFGGNFTIQSKIAGAVERVKGVLLEAGMDGIRHSDLHRRSQHHINAHDLKLLCDIMHELGMIQVFEVPGTRGKVYRATRGIEQLNVNSSILARLGAKGQSIV